MKTRMQDFVFLLPLSSLRLRRDYTLGLIQSPLKCAFTQLEESSPSPPKKMSLKQEADFFLFLLLKCELQWPEREHSGFECSLLSGCPVLLHWGEVHPVPTPTFNPRN